MKRPVPSVNRGAFCIVLLIISVMVACSNPSQKVVELKRFPIDSLDGIITQSGAELDKDNSSDGKGSLRVNAKNPATVRLFEVRDVDVEDAVLTYRAKVRAKGLTGRAYLEMRCHLPDGEEFFSTNPQTALTGTTKWMTVQTPFTLKKGEKPDVIKLNLVIEGKGTVWIDDVHLVKGPLQ